MRKVWTIWLVLGAALLLGAQGVSAQVAAPRLNPVTPEAPEAFNPATLPWSGPSRIGAALSYQSTTESTTNGVTTLDAEGDGKFLGSARLIGETFAFSAETLEVEFTQPATTSTGTFSATMLNLAAVLGESFGLGVGLQENTQAYESTAGPVAFDVEYKQSLPQAGVVLKLGEGVFLGASGGTETLEGRVTFPSLAIDVFEESERDVKRVGLGYFNRGQDGGFHVEIYREAKDFGEFQDTSLTDVEEEDTGALTFEFIFYNFLLGVERINTEKSDLTGIAGKENNTVLHLGWVPATGLAITATLYDTERTYQNSTQVDNEEATFIAIAWLF